MASRRFRRKTETQGKVRGRSKVNKLAHKPPSPGYQRQKSRTTSKTAARATPIIKSRIKSRLKRPKKYPQKQKHPRKHFGLDGDKPSFTDNFKNIRVKHLGHERLPKIKRELKIKELREVEQVRGVQRIPGITLPSAKEEIQFSASQKSESQNIGSHQPDSPNTTSHQSDSQRSESQNSTAIGARPRSAQGPFPTIVICGMGFGGLTVAKELTKQLSGKGKIIGIDSSDRFMFIPSLMALAGGFFSASDISVPIKKFSEQLGMEFVHDTVVSINPKTRVVHTRSGEFPYDYVVVALGAASNPLPPGFDEKTLALRHVWDAQEIWKTATRACDNNSQGDPSSSSPSSSSSLIPHSSASSKKSFEVNIGIIGGGPTGIQLASWLKDGVQQYIKKKWGRKGKAIITLLQSGPDLVPGCPIEARKAAHDLLVKQGVQVVLNAKARGSKENVISLEDGTTFPMDAVVFCGGWRQSPVLPTLGLSMDERSGLNCTSYLQSVDDPFVFAVGDALNFSPSDVNIPGWKRAQNARLVANTAAYNILANSKDTAMDSFEVKDTPVILDLRPKSILIRNGRTSVGRFWWHVAQWIRRLNLFVVRHPRIPIPY